MCKQESTPPEYLSVYLVTVQYSEVFQNKSLPDYSPIVFNERVTFWLQCISLMPVHVRTKKCMLHYLCMRLAYSNYTITHAYNAANTRPRQCLGALKPISYTLVDGNQTIMILRIYIDLQSLTFGVLILCLTFRYDKLTICSTIISLHVQVQVNNKILNNVYVFTSCHFRLKIDEKFINTSELQHFFVNGASIKTGTTMEKERWVPSSSADAIQDVSYVSLQKL